MSPEYMVKPPMAGVHHGAAPLARNKAASVALRRAGLLRSLPVQRQFTRPTAFFSR